MALSFTNEKNIHLICDEIYSATVFDEPGFVSIAEILAESPDANPDLVHIVYSLSKDLGFPGFRVGILYSYNDAVVCCASKMSSFGLVSTQTQRMLASMLVDEEFVGKFLAESAARLATFEAEMELWRVIVNDVRINVSPGASFHCAEPGWFRVCFANMDEETMRVALSRISKLVVQSKSSEARKQCRRRSKLEISLSFRRLEEMMMSPHSPMTSPLVRTMT
ncbi:hypothetical protein SASPL_153481 [Salvia splendens]|uniref:1-aminocyclopropane-1-carboxylate synthase n=1 Tax=Salvia splendens TaxID=180675 RepID=A0A8X8W5J7_SALSN|nr:hypothetical protein SASPL_153481 [Salvia splendens]